MKTRAIFAFTLIFGLMSGALMAQNDGWTLLGTRKVDFGLDRDVIPVTWRDGAFTSLKITVRGGLNMHKCVVHFENGGTQEIPLRENFRGRSATRTIDLNGNKRLIEKVVFWYDTKGLRAREATIHLWGKR